MPDYKFLNNINFPSDIKKLSNSDLKLLSKEIRAKMIPRRDDTRSENMKQKQVLKRVVN